MALIGTSKDEHYSVIKEDGDARFNAYIDASNGCYVPPSKVLEIVRDLLAFCQEYTEDEILNYNTGILLTDEYELLWDAQHATEEAMQRNTNNMSGYIYLLECGGAYKIGYSKNVKQRMKSLDTRPFKLNLIYKWYSDYARTIEGILHRRLSGYRLEGEWYSSNLPIKTLGDIISELDRGMKQCEVT